MGSVRALQVGSVRHSHLQTVLGGIGVEWSRAGHITATVSLARAILRQADGGIALPVATLVELISLPGYPEGYALPVDGFPGPDVRQTDEYREYARQVSLWTSRASGLRIRIGLELGDALRRYRREIDWGDSVGRAVLESGREFAKTIQTLVASGVNPARIRPAGSVACWAAKAWEWIERQLPVLASIRNDLWTDREAFRSGTTEHARDLQRRIRHALSTVFGERDGSLTLVHHGFYFYTPPQWALFQLLREMDGIDQVFIVHDDGRNAAFEIWRRFFQVKWRMPPGEPTGGGDGMTPSAAALDAALRGEGVNPDQFGKALRIVECRSPSEFVRFVAQEQSEGAQGGKRDGATVPRIYAADKPSIKRYCARLGVEPGGGPVDLAQLPVGAFLLRLHDCIHADREGNITVTLDSDALVDIVGSGFLRTDASGGEDPGLQSALMRALPFFRGCSSCAEWDKRAASLAELVTGQVAPRGERRAWDSDRERIAAAGENNFRLVPWADLSRTEVHAVRHAVEATTALLRELAGRERVKLDRHFGFIRRELERGMADLPAEERERIEAKLSGFGVALEAEVDVEGLVDVVSLLLGRRVDFDALGEEDDQQDSGIRALRNLDELGFCRSPSALHLANLADGAFPAAAQPVGWPFTVRDLEGTPAPIVELLEARAEHAALGDLYLLWLALDGVEDGRAVTLSWISDVGGDPRNPSSVLAMLARPPVPRWDAVLARAGGVAVSHVASGAEGSALFDAAVPEPSDIPDDQLERAMTRIHRRALAAVHVCPRRFALQWALGPSAAFMQEHQHRMLYGNVVGAFEHAGGVPAETCELLWQQFTDGERASSLANRRVKPDGAWRDWMLTLGGSRSADDAQSRAYRYASSGTPRPDVAAFAEGVPLLLPPAPAAADAGSRCLNCPVKPRCSHWVSDRD